MEPIKYLHLRYAKYLPGVAEPVLDNMGGVTVAFQRVSPGVFKVGFAFCSKKDSYCKRFGRGEAVYQLCCAKSNVESKNLTATSKSPDTTLGELAQDIKELLCYWDGWLDPKAVKHLKAYFIQRNGSPA